MEVALSCLVPRCERRLYMYGYCRTHWDWRLLKRYEKPCGKDGCMRRKVRYKHHGLCAFHATANLGRPHDWTDEDLQWALVLLEDGAGYREASRSSGVPKTTLRDKYPGMGMKLSEAGFLGAYVASDMTANKLQQEIGFLRNEIH